MASATIEQINEALDLIRPHLRVDGGDVEVISINTDNTVSIRLLGACNCCPLNLMTLRAGIERVIMNKFPEIVRVESVT